MEQTHTASVTAAARLTAITPAVMRGEALQEVFNLDEGPVTLTFPATLSAESYADLKDHLDLFLRKAKRQADRRLRDQYGKDDE